MSRSLEFRCYIDRIALKILQASRQSYCQGTCKNLEHLEKPKSEFRNFEISRNLAVRWPSIWFKHINFTTFGGQLYNYTSIKLIDTLAAMCYTNVYK